MGGAPIAVGVGKGIPSTPEAGTAVSFRSEIEADVQDVEGYVAHLGRYAAVFLRWMLISVVIAVPCGLLGSAFHMGVDLATSFRMENPWVLYTLPGAGLAAVAIYRGLECEGLSTDSVLDQVQNGEGLRLKLLPAIFLTTILTHFAGGSAGREGAALQMGGTIGLGASRLFHLDDRDQRTAIMIGMAAFFSALFGTPVAASVFAMAVISVGVLYLAAFVPCLIASLTAYGISLTLGVEPTRFAVAMPEVTPLMLAQVALLAWFCGMLSVVFCEVLHKTEHAVRKHVENPWVRAALGGAVLLALTLAVGTGDYNGAGMDVIARAVEQGQAEPFAFLLKIAFTTITLSVGFKGGEVVPCFFIGATFGCAVGPLIGLPAGFSAAVGLISMFCACVNCPIASIFLALELFGGGGLIFFALCCGLSFVLSGYSGLYSSQRILYDKLKARYIDVHANAYHEGGFERHHHEE